jgi:hypothetical protein
VSRPEILTSFLDLLRPEDLSRPPGEDLSRDLSRDLFRDLSLPLDWSRPLDLSRPDVGLSLCRDLSPDDLSRRAEPALLSLERDDLCRPSEASRPRELARREEDLPLDLN